MERLLRKHTVKTARRAFMIIRRLEADAYIQKKLGFDRVTNASPFIVSTKEPVYNSSSHLSLSLSLSRNLSHYFSNTVEPRFKASAYKAMPVYKAFTKNP